MKSLSAFLFVALAPFAYGQDMPFFHTRYEIFGTSGNAGDRSEWKGELFFGEQFQPVAVFRATSNRGEEVVFSGRATETNTALFSSKPSTSYAIAVEPGFDRARVLELMAKDSDSLRQTQARLSLYTKNGTFGGRTPNGIEFEAREKRGPAAERVRDVWVATHKDEDYLCESGSHYMYVFVQGWSLDLRVTGHGNLDRFEYEEVSPFFSRTIARGRLTLHKRRFKRQSGQYELGLWKSTGSARIPRELDSLRVRVKGDFSFGEVALERLDVTYRELSGEVTSERGGEVQVEGLDYYSGPILRTAAGEEVILFGRRSGGWPKKGEALTVRGYFVPQSRVLAVTDTPPPAIAAGAGGGHVTGGLLGAFGQ